MKPSIQNWEKFQWPYFMTPYLMVIQDPSVYSIVNSINFIELNNIMSFWRTHTERIMHCNAS